MKKAPALPLPSAQQKLITAATAGGCETIASAAALGRVLAEDIHTPRAFPDTRRSAVDGYALDQTGRELYRVGETLGAGELPQQQLGGAQAAAVMTGATVPEGGIAVVRVEDTERDGDDLIVKAGVSAGENINNIGEEMAAGTIILRAGTRLTPVAHSVLCATGIAEVSVYRLPRIGILITGNEVLQLGAPHRPGSVYDSNRHFLVGCLTQLGLDCTVLGPVNDEEVAIRNGLEELAESCDLVISSGGVSMGKYDFIRPLLHSSGFELLVNGTGIKPGRPLIVARRDGTLFFGMPGYPAACLVNFYYYLLPTLKALMGLTEVMPVTRPVVLAETLKGRKGRWDILRLHLDSRDGQTRAWRLSSQLTSHFLNFGNCTGLTMLDAESDSAAAGDCIELLDFRLQF
ncbi:MAG: molybdopterin molybdenumtransferase MoeA [Desulfuromonas sp.]|mgnify:CR=1 FL=1|nr:MAG: molybdopterin molybdenumtransferase MoeA [Desulfuromonas sp.]